MYFYAMSSVLADMCGNSIYYNKHPEECWSKEDIRNYKERQKKSAHDAQIEQRNLNKIAPPATLIESVVKQCIINKIYDQEIYDSSLKVESSIGLPKTLAEKLNGIEYYGYITYTAFLMSICYLHNVRPCRQRVADLLRNKGRRAATPCRQ